MNFLLFLSTVKSAIFTSLSCSSLHHVHLTLVVFSLKVLYIRNTGCIQSWKTWKSHGIPCFFPGLEISWKLTPAFGKFMKSHGIKRHPLAKQRCSFLSSIILIQGYIYVIRSNLVSSISSCIMSGTLWVLLVGKTGGSSWPRWKLMASVHVSFMPRSM